MVIAMRALKAAVNTRTRGCFIAMRAAMRKVLSPISEKMIMVRESKKEWRGCMRDSGVAASNGIEGVYWARIARGSDFWALGGAGCGIECGLSGKSSGF